MQKALHDYFYINTGKELKLYSYKESAFLIEAANLHLSIKNHNDSQNNLHALNVFIYELMDEYYQNGVSDNLLNKLNKIIVNVKIQCLVENVENKVSTVHIA